MKGNQAFGTPFREGAEVVSAEGSHQGTLSVFLQLRKSVNWADIAECNGAVRGHPVVRLDNVTDMTPGYSDLKPAKPQTPVKGAARPSSWTHF
jgi:hypothetical protein